LKNKRVKRVKTSNEKPLGGCRVLVVEEEAMLLLSTADILASAGATISGHATTVMSAIHNAKSKDFDCAVMDIGLRGGDVYPAARIVRDRGKGIVFVTASPDLPELKREWPNAEVLAKPASEAEVIRATADACKRGGDHATSPLH